MVFEPDNNTVICFSILKSFSLSFWSHLHAHYHLSLLRFGSHRLHESYFSENVKIWNLILHQYVFILCTTYQMVFLSQRERRRLWVNQLSITISWSKPWFLDFTVLQPHYIYCLWQILVQQNHNFLPVAAAAEFTEQNSVNLTSGVYYWHQLLQPVNSRYCNRISHQCFLN